jgi:hypothetical protein
MGNAALTGNSDVTGVTLFIVAKFTAGSSAYRIVASVIKTGFTQLWEIRKRSSAGGLDQWESIGGTGNSFPAQTGDLPTGVYVMISNWEQSTGNLYFYNKRSFQAVINDPATPALNEVSVGGRAAANFHLDDVFEVIIYKRPLTNQDQTSVSLYLEDKWNPI